MTTVTAYQHLYETLDAQELAAIKLLLNENDVPFRVQNEYSLDTGGAYLMGYQGASIEVRAEDRIYAKMLLSSIGIESLYDEEKHNSPLLEQVESLTKSVPGLKDLPVSLRFFILLSIVLSLLTGLLLGLML